MWKQWQTLFLGVTKITADGDCSHEIKKCLLLGEGNGNPLQYSCLENPMDGGAWYPWGRKESDTTERLHFLSFFTSWKKSYDQPRQNIKKQRHYFANKGPSSQSYILSSSCMDLRVEPERKLSAKELILLKCGVGEDS